jgi:hypothetical protein
MNSKRPISFQIPIGEQPRIAALLPHGGSIILSEGRLKLKDLKFKDLRLFRIFVVYKAVLSKEMTVFHLLFLTWIAGIQIQMHLYKKKQSGTGKTEFGSGALVGVLYSPGQHPSK